MLFYYLLLIVATHILLHCYTNDATVLQYYYFHTGPNKKLDKLQ